MRYFYSGINNFMKLKYVTPGKTSKRQGDGRPGRYVDPQSWKTGPDIFVREKYYAYLRHKAQCNYRKEPYELTWEDWQQSWPDDQFLRRGKGLQDLIMQRLDLLDSWNPRNVAVTTRAEHVKRAKEYRSHDRNI